MRSFQGIRALPGAGTVTALLVLAAAGCESEPPTVPSAAEVESYYTIPSRASIEMSGNVAEIEVTQPTDQLRRGGTLWASVGPYIYLFTEATRDLFTDFDGLAAVRVITRTPSGDLVARATLRRDALNGITWKRALNVAGHARKSGTDRPSRLEDLVDWGEEHTDFEYNPRYTSRR